MILLEQLNPLQIAFIIAAPAAVILLVLIFILGPMRRRRHKKHFMEYCYKAIYRIAFDEDYYLINDFYFRVDTSHVAKIDHILFGEKYIYIISDTYFDGDLSGQDTDKSLIITNRKGQKFYTDNLYNSSQLLINYLSTSTGIDKSLFIGVALVNNECKLSVISNSKSLYLIQRNKLKKLVKAIESRQVGKINAQQLDNAVKAIDKLNRKKRHK
ncbi:MAG: NERD domain-containing protein [Bacilli bacterium]|nr:NERD domain-containing protein [Bacilli bacterium]